jgi:hypothetical protein
LFFHKFNQIRLTAEGASVVLARGIMPPIAMAYRLMIRPRLLSSTSVCSSVLPHQPQHEAGTRASVDRPRHGDPLHPVADQRYALAAEKKPQVPLPQSPDDRGEKL